MTVLSGTNTEQPGRLVLDAPQVPDALPLLDDEGQAQMVPIDAQNRALKVVIERAWDGYDGDYKPDQDVRFEFFWRPIGAGEFQRVSTSPDLPMPQDPAQLFPYQGVIPELYLRTPGIFEIRYSLQIAQVGNPVDSEATKVNIDKSAPNSGNPGVPIVLKDPTDLIDQAYLDAHADQVPATIARWSDIRLEDVVELFLEPVRGPIGDPLGRLVIDQALTQLEHIPVSLAGDEVRRKGNGPRQFYYRLLDRADNVGQVSAETHLQVYLAGAVRLPTPQVPGSEDGLLDLEDVRRGVQVQIGEIAEAAAGDVLRATWNGRALPAFTVPPAQRWPASIPVDWNTLAADGFAGPVPVQVVYQFIPGSGQPLLSPMTHFNIDLSVAGPNPEGPGPVNDQLELAVVKGLSGDNLLLAGDVGLPVRVEVDLYAGPRPGEVLELVWGSVPGIVATYTVQDRDREGDVVSFSGVPYSVVEQQGDGLVAVFYHTVNGANRQRSRDTDVRVATQPLEGFKRVEFPDATLFNWINCDAQPWNGIRVQIPGDDQRLAPGDSIELIWQLFAGPAGEGPALSEKVYFPARKLTAEEAANGVIVNMDRFTDLVLPVREWGTPRGEGSARVEYRVLKANGGVGVSSERILSISLLRPGGLICDGLINK